MAEDLSPVTSFYVAGDDGSILRLQSQVNDLLSNSSDPSSIVEFLKEHEKLLTFIAGFMLSAESSLEWLKEALKNLELKLDVLTTKLTNVTREIENLQLKLSQLPRQTVSELIRSELHGLLVRYNQASNGLRGDEDREFYLSQMEKVFGDTDRLAGKFVGQGDLANFSLAPSVVVLLPLLTSVSEVRGAPKKYLSDWTSTLSEFVSGALDPNTPLSLPSLEARFRRQRDLVSQRITTESQPIIRKYVRYKGLESLYMTIRISFPGDPSSGFSFVREEKEWRREYQPPPRNERRGGSGGNPFGAGDVPEDEDAEVSESSLGQSVTHIFDENLFASAREDTTYRRVSKDTHSIDDANRVGIRQVEVLNSLAAAWRDENRDHLVASATLAATVNIPNLIDSVQQRLSK